MARKKKVLQRAKTTDDIAAAAPNPQLPTIMQGINPQGTQVNPYNPFQQYAGSNYNIPQANQQNTQMNTQRLEPKKSGGHWWDFLKYLSPIAALSDPQWLKDNLLGSPPTVESANRFSPFQQNALNFLTQQGIGGISQTPFNFAPIANQQLENFYTQTVPSLAERFTAMGGGQRSSAFQGALGNAGRFLGNDLAAQQGQYNLQQQGNLLNMLNLGLTPQSEQFAIPGSAGLLPGLVNAGVQLGQTAIKAGI